MFKSKKYFLLGVIIFTCNCNIESQLKVDLVPFREVADTFYGKICKDPYRILEDTKKPLVDNWLHKQSEKSSTIIRSIPNWEKIYNKQKESLEKRARKKFLKVTNGNELFYLKKGIEDKVFKLCYRKEFYGKEIVLFDPNDYKKSSNNKYVINYIQPSWDATKVVIGFTKGDIGFSELAILDVNTKKLHPEVISNCWPTALGGVSWLSDNSGFFYTHVPIMDKSSKDYLLNTASVLYKIGLNPNELNVIFSAEKNTHLQIKPADIPIVSFKPYFKNIIIGKIGGASNYHDYYYSKIDSKGEISEWKPLFKKENRIKTFSFDGENFYFLSALNSPNFKLCKTKLSRLDFIKPEILIEEDSYKVISDFALTKKGIFYVKNKNGVESQLYCLINNKEKRIEIPKRSGFINVTSKTPLSDDLWIETEGWTSEIIRYRYFHDECKFKKEDLYPNPSYPELEDVIIKEIEIVSHDGIKVPLSIIHKKNVKLDGNNQVLLGGYGAFGFTETPYLYSYLRHWVREGGIYATAHVRGGGEKGDNWYRSGFKQTKPNSWKDFIACSEYLIEKEYTNPDKLAIWSGSAGGILIARAITERPDLYKSAFIYAGIINMLRAEFGPNGKNTVKEYGTVKDSADFFALLEMDACQHVKKETKYPAVLLLAGANDSRVPIWHSAKFAALLQKANTSNNPVLLSINFEGGHGNNLNGDDWNKLNADVISFALWQTGHPDFQLKE